MSTLGTVDVALVDRLFGVVYSKLPPEICRVEEAQVERLPRFHRVRFRLMQAGVARMQLTDAALHAHAVARGLADADVHTDLNAFLRLNNEHAIGLLVTGRLADAVEPLVRVRWWSASLEEVDSLWTVASVNLANCLGLLGDYEGAYALNMEVFERLGDGSSKLSYLGLLSHLVINGCRAGQAEAVRAQCAVLEQRIGSDQLGQLRLLLSGAKAHLALEDGRHEEALAWALEGLGALASVDPDDAALLYQVAGRAAFALGQLDQAKHYGEKQVQASEVFSEGILRFEALELLGQVAAAQGDHQEVLRLLTQTTSLARARSKQGLVPMFSRMVGRFQERISKQEAELLHTNQRLQANISALAVARDKAEAAARARHGFLSSMSHEIRTPLHGVLGNAELLADSSLDENQAEMVGMIQRSAGLTLSIVDDILDLRKLEEGQLMLDPVPFRLLQPAEDVVSSLQKMAQDKGVALLLTASEGLPERVRGDDRRLQQVLLNLTSNALKFTAEGRVELRIDQREGRLRFAVRDSGIGIPEDRQAAIFDAYVQADAGTARRSGGTGLGLPICRHLVSLMGGELGVLSTPGQGSIFSFEIALQHAGEGLPAAPTVQSLQGMRLMVAEDNLINRRVIERMLVSLAADVTVLDCGEKALAQAMLRQPDVLLLDLHMPDLNGDEVCERLRASGYEKPVLALTASAMEEDRRACLASGMNGYLSKPLTRETLAREIRRVSSS